MYSVNMFDLIESYSTTNVCWIVYIAHGQFSFEDEVVLKRELNLFGEKAEKVALAIKVDNFVVFEEESEARKLFKIMNENFYRKVYCGLFGPEGMVTENC